MLPLLHAIAAAATSVSAAASDTTAYVVINHGRPAGEMLVIVAGDSVVVRYHHVDRQRGPRSETRYRLTNGVTTGAATWNLPLYGPEPTPRGEPADRFDVERDSLSFTVRDSVRRVAFAPATSFYRLRSNTPYETWRVVQHLLRQRDRTTRLTPGGSARLEIAHEATVRTQSGRHRLRFAVVSYDRAPVPGGVWIDDKGALVAGQIGWFIAVRRGMEDVLPALRTAELAWRNARGEELARRVAPAGTPAVAIVNGDVFDSERGIMRPRTNVIIRGDRIVAVGPPDVVRPPEGATIVDATGKTVMPGMWDMHTHFQHTSQSAGSVAQLANGITTIRDLAADLDVAVSHRDRANAGMLASPRAILGGFIEGPGRWAGPSDAIATTEAEALAWVARYDSLGYRQIKLYNLVQQDLVPAIATEAHRRGLRLSGHVPRGMSTTAAVRLGFDEINHAAFLFSTFYPESLYVPVMRAYSGVAQIVAPHVDVEGAAVTALIDTLKARGTVIDGTWQLWLSAPNPTSTAVGIPPAASATAAERADANYLRMLKRLFDAGVPIVPGTDGASYHGELEVYERAGIPAPEVLRIATITSATVMGEAQDYGSIAVGKVADIAIIDGRPAERVADLRKVERVVRAGRLYESAALRAAIGMAADLTP